MSKLPNGVTNFDAVMVTIYDIASYLAGAFGLYLLIFTDNDQQAQWVFIAALLFNAASNARMVRVLGRRTTMNRHPSGRGDR